MNKNIRYLIEGIVNFNPADYDTDDQDLIDTQTVDDVIRTPKSLDELKKIVIRRLIENPKNPYLLDIDISNITDMSGLFNNLRYLERTGYNEYFNEYGVSPTNIETLDLSTWDTSNVTKMCNLFVGCEQLKNLDLTGWDTSNVTNMKQMFAACHDIKKLNISHFNTDNVEDMSCMFYGCRSLQELDLSNFNTSKVIDMNNMFYRCLSLEKLNISSFNTAEVIDMTNMFFACETLTNLDLSSFDTSNVELMICMFQGCDNLERIDVSDKWTTYNVEDMGYMFSGCKSLIDMDFSNFYISLQLKYNTRSSRTIMFKDCKQSLIDQFIYQCKVI